MNTIYRKKKMGPTHGPLYGPSYANIFMDDFERQILARIDRASGMWLRYTDGVFVIWPHSKEHLITVMDELTIFTHP